MPCVSKKQSHRERVLKAYRSFRGSQVPVRELVYQFYSAIDTPVALSCWLQYEANELSDLVSRSVDPSMYLDFEGFQRDYAAVSFLRKSEFLKTGFNTKEEALKSFHKAELQCRDTNRRFRDLALVPEYKGINAAILHSMTRKIAQILDGGGSSAKTFDIDELLDACAWGPGASVAVKGADTGSIRKFREEHQITSCAHQLFGEILDRAYPLWYRDGALNERTFLEFSKVITVNKNAKTDRTIAVEPGLNIWLQKGVGKMIRRRLKRCGVNLDDDGKNRAGARIGSRLGTLATVDFSSASDTISRGLVREVLPRDWHVVLDSIRTRCYTIGKVGAVFEKFSSMGNGFTFELESLIFYALALAVCDHLQLDTKDVSVFGDDVVLPTDAYQLYCSAANFLGFTVNLQKSYAEGPFRESCGAYYFNGVDVKPYFFKKVLNSPMRVYGFVNGISELAARFTGLYECRHAAFLGVWESAVACLPKILKVFGDVTGGDGCIWSNFDQARPTKLRGQLEGYSFSCFNFPAKVVETDSPAVLVARLAVASTLMEHNNTSPLRRVTQTQWHRVSTRQWCNWGRWIWPR